MEGLPLMDDLLEWLAPGFWTTLMEESEMILFFWYPISCPFIQGLSRMLLSFDVCLYYFG